MNFEKLENNIIDVIKEEQAKLGYREEDIRLYYPLSSLNHFFDAQMDSDEMNTMLKGFANYTKERLGLINVSNKGDRFCFFIPSTGVTYVRKNTKSNEFIKELVELIGNHGCTLEKIKNLFLSKSPNVHIEKINNGEFDYLIYFEDMEEDKYYYCFKDEGFHIIYHRFLPQDYAEFNF